LLRLNPGLERAHSPSPVLRNYDNFEDWESVSQMARVATGKGLDLPGVIAESVASLVGWRRVQEHRFRDAATMSYHSSRYGGGHACC